MQKEIFKDFYFYYNEYDKNDKNNTPIAKFKNIHINNNFVSMAEELGTEIDTVKDINCFDHGFLKNRMMSSSSSTSIFKHNKTNSVLNLGVTNSLNTNTTIHKRSFSTTSFNI
jgi:hypothetical protein